MSDRRAELVELTNQFVDAFNRQDLDAIVAAFGEGAIYEDTRGGHHEGADAIRTAFTPLVGGAMGKIHFDEEDLFIEVETGKVMASWRLSMTVDGNPVVMRGLDLLHFQGDRLMKKLAYTKAKEVRFES